MGNRREPIILTGSWGEAAADAVDEGGGGGGGAEPETRNGRSGVMGVELAGGGN